jgi:serine/threonine-protein kinase
MASNDASAFGKYRLIAELGHGGMADVFLAVQQGIAGFNKLVVVKRLRPNLAEDPEFIGMLLDEARIAARLNHPNVVQTNEIGNVEEHYYIAMEYLDGQPLHRIIRRAESSGGIPTRLHYAALCGVLAGLHHAHELSDFDGAPLEVVHRDVSPHNVFITYDGQVKIVDFGIAKALRRTSAETRQGVLKGKIKYMSPEQVLNKNIDRRADVFAMGILLWEAAVGTRLWQGAEELDVMQALVKRQFPASPRSKNPDVPEAIDRICQRALAPLDERYATALEMQNDLLQYLSADRPTEREVGDYVAKLFDDKRQLIRSIIEEKLAQIATMPSGNFQLPKVVDTFTGTSSVSIEAPQLAAKLPSRPSKPKLADGMDDVDVTGKLDGPEVTKHTELTGTTTNNTSLRSRRANRPLVIASIVAMVGAAGFIAIRQHDIKRLEELGSRTAAPPSMAPIDAPPVASAPATASTTPTPTPTPTTSVVAAPSATPTVPRYGGGTTGGGRGTVNHGGGHVQHSASATTAVITPPSAAAVTAPATTAAPAKSNADPLGLDERKY